LGDVTSATSLAPVNRKLRENAVEQYWSANNEAQATNIAYKGIINSVKLKIKEKTNKLK
jgi:hypothetical protein